MSKISKERKKALEKKAREEKKKKAMKAIIISAVSVAVVSILAVVSIFVIKPAVQKKIEDKKRRESFTVSSNDYSDEEMKEYRNTKLPAMFVDFLKKAEKDSEEACKKYGVAMELNGNKISVPEFAFYYYRKTNDQLTDTINSIKEKGSNMTGFDPEIAPSKQNYMKGEKNWDEKLTDEFVEDLKLKMFVFDKAMESGYVPSKDAVGNIKELKEMMENVTASRGGEDAYIESIYFEGFTAAMFYKYDIITQIAEDYNKRFLKEKSKSYDGKVVQAKIDEAPYKYKTVNVNIYPIENPESLEKAKNVKTYEEYCSFVKGETGSADYNPEIATDYHEVRYDDISGYFGEPIAQWVFNSNRKVGDVEVVMGTLYNCLIYMRELPRDTCSCNFLIYGVQYDQYSDAEKIKKETQDTFDELGAEKMTEKKFREFLEDLGTDYEQTAYVKELEYEADKWVHSSERKKGDVACINGSQASYIIMFLGENPDDVYSQALVRGEMATEELKQLMDKAPDNIKIKNDSKKAIALGEERYLEFYYKVKNASENTTAA